MASFVHNNWKDHLGISVSELCFKNALGLLINKRSNFREKRIIVRKMAVTFRGEQIIARKFGVNYRAKRIIIRKITQIKTIRVTKMRGNFFEISFQAKFLRKATKSRNFIEIHLHYFCTVLYSTYNTIQYSTKQYNTILTLSTMLNLHKYKDTLTLHLKQCNNIHYYNCN